MTSRLSRMVMFAESVDFLTIPNTLFSNGDGRSVMISDFLVQHCPGPFFQLNERQWMGAIQKYPELSQDNGIQYGEYSATVWILIRILVTA